MIKPDASHTDADADAQATESRPFWWQRLLAWLARGAAATENDRRGACPT